MYSTFNLFHYYDEKQDIVFDINPLVDVLDINYVPNKINQNMIIKYNDEKQKSINNLTINLSQNNINTSIQDINLSAFLSITTLTLSYVKQYETMSKFKLPKIQVSNSSLKQIVNLKLQDIFSDVTDNSTDGLKFPNTFFSIVKNEINIRKMNMINMLDFSDFSGNKITLQYLVFTKNVNAIIFWPQSEFETLEITYCNTCSYLSDNGAEKVLSEINLDLTAVSLNHELVLRNVTIEVPYFYFNCKIIKLRRVKLVNQVSMQWLEMPNLHTLEIVKSASKSKYGSEDFFDLSEIYVTQNLILNDITAKVNFLKFKGKLIKLDKVIFFNMEPIDWPVIELDTLILGNCYYVNPMKNSLNLSTIPYIREFKLYGNPMVPYSEIIFPQKVYTLYLDLKPMFEYFSSFFFQNVELINLSNYCNGFIKYKDTRRKHNKQSVQIDEK
jgi:hypothetical protein